MHTNFSSSTVAFFNCATVVKAICFITCCSKSWFLRNETMFQCLFSEPSTSHSSETKPFTVYDDKQDLREVLE